jgi:hypothetical protein
MWLVASLITSPLVGDQLCGQTHLGPTIGLSLLEKGWWVLLTHTSDLVQKLQQRAASCGRSRHPASGPISFTDP